MGAIPSGKGGERFPQLPPKAGFGGILGEAAAGGDPWTSSGQGGVREGKEGGGRRPARAQDIGLVAPARMARQLRRVGDDVALPVAPHALARQFVAPGGLARQGQYPGPAGLFSPTLSFLPSVLPEQSASRATPPATAPRSPTNPVFWRGESGGKRSPPFPEGIAPIFSSFNHAHL